MNECASTGNQLNKAQCLVKQDVAINRGELDLHELSLNSEKYEFLNEIGGN